jgi:L-asparagine transporter-like permease
MDVLNIKNNDSSNSNNLFSYETGRNILIGAIAAAATVTFASISLNYLHNRRIFRSCCCIIAASAAMSLTILIITDVTLKLSSRPPQLFYQ